MICELYLNITFQNSGRCDHLPCYDRFTIITVNAAEQILHASAELKLHQIPSDWVSLMKLAQKDFSVKQPLVFCLFGICLWRLS